MTCSLAFPAVPSIVVAQPVGVAVLLTVTSTVGDEAAELYAKLHDTR